MHKAMYKNIRTWKEKKGIYPKPGQIASGLAAVSLPKVYASSAA